MEQDAICRTTALEFAYRLAKRAGRYIDSDTLVSEADPIYRWLVKT